MVKIQEAIVVEGRYDKNMLSQIVDAPIFQTNGFSIRKDKELLGLLRQVAQKRGLIVLTDSDGAGFVIRNFLKGAIPASLLKHAYIPDIPGKERRKSAPGKEGKLGVEGLGFISIAHVEKFSILSEVALGFIAFSIGNEFRVSQLKKIGKQATIIGILQAVVTTLLVDAALIVLHYINPTALPLEAAIILGAIASATAPAASSLFSQILSARAEIFSTASFAIAKASKTLDVLYVYKGSELPLYFILKVLFV